jgi:hypothetical protein
LINNHEHITSCPRWATCSTPVYTGSCSKICFELKNKYERVYGKSSIAYWRSRAQHNDYLWAECSNCGFRVEAYNAVVCGKSSSDFVDVKYKFCPICGKEMRV